MNVVNYSEAARIAGVSRQMIGRIKKLHDDKKEMKSYFVFDPKDGKPGIDIDNKEWLTYVDRNNYQRVNKIKPITTTKLQPSDVDMKNYVNKDVLNIMVETLKEEIDLPLKKLRHITDIISDRYEKKYGKIG